MTELFATAVTFRDDQPITTSQIIAEIFEKRHDNVLRDIEALLQTEREMLEQERALRSEGTFLDQQAPGALTRIFHDFYGDQP